jgi:hypothetical protein
MKTRKKTTKKAAAVKPETDTITINIDVLNEEIDNAIAVMMACRSVLNLIAEASEEAGK